MADYYEIDFLAVETKKSGDAIAMRYRVGGEVTIHVTDGGYQETGVRLVEHIVKYYDNPTVIDHVVVTHNDGDHTAGLISILEKFEVKNLWMLRPWLYSGELLERFSYYHTAHALEGHLREVYGNLAMIEDVATKKNIPIYEPFQGSKIGAFQVTAPKKERYLDLVVTSEKTSQEKLAESNKRYLAEISDLALNKRESIWGEESFPSQGTLNENEMSVVQFGVLCGKNILLTGDTGRAGLSETTQYLQSIWMHVPEISFFQVPHHGSRHNVDSEVLNQLIGPILDVRPNHGESKFTAFVSSALADKHHPRKSVVAAMIHRGAKVFATEGKSLLHHSKTSPDRSWIAATPEVYPETLESDS